MPNPHLTIEWDDVPEEIKSAAEQDSNDFLWLLPPWLHELTFRYNSKLETDLRNSTNPRYRWAVIIFGPSYLQYSVKERRNSLIHEILHTALAPLQNVTERLLKGRDDFAEDTYDFALEEVVSDLALVISKKI